MQQGLDNKQLATALSISEGTLKWHLHNIFGKLQVRNRTQAVQVSRQHGLIK
ncbi:MAG: helix-turn-helix transcriptional regulator [Burkholderiales bacterium]